MSNALYRLYVNDVFQLAETLVLKSSVTADLMNTWLSWMGVDVDPLRPETWKYYCHLAGVYHHTDREMIVTSIDTLEPIVFNKETLAVHLGTRREYQYGTPYYRELVQRFPDQEALILGILHPVDPAVAIAAQDGDILYYDPALVESNERTLIQDLQYAIRAFLTRWDNPGYALTDDLYPAALLGQLYVQLPLMIMNLRLARCKTSEAHSFHIRAYLASHGRLDRYLAFLTKKQALFLYRDIQYLERNAGRQETFDTLVQRLFTDRGLPLGEYTTQQNHDAQPDAIYATPELVRHPLNTPFVGRRKDAFDVLTVLHKQRNEARENWKIIDAAEGSITEQLQLSTHDHYKTKVLESVAVDRTDYSPYTLSDVLLYHWLYWSTTDRYRTFITVTNPQNGERLTLSVKEAFVVFLYSYNAANGLRLSEIPLLEARHVRRDVPPTAADLWAVVDPQYVDTEQVTAALSHQPIIGQYVSTVHFHDACETIHAALMAHRWLYTQTEHPHTRGHLEHMVGCFYHDIECDLAAGTPYDTWFADRAYPFGELTANEHAILAEELVRTATGADLNNAKTLREIQAAMVKLMGQLSSYSVHFLRSINATSVLVAEWAAQRIGETRMLGLVGWDIDAAAVRIKDWRGRGQAQLTIPLAEGGFVETAHAQGLDRARLGVGVDIQTTEGRMTYQYRQDLSGVRVLDVRMPPSPTPDGIELGSL